MTGISVERTELGGKKSWMERGLVEAVANVRKPYE